MQFRSMLEKTPNPVYDLAHKVTKTQEISNANATSLIEQFILCFCLFCFILFYFYTSQPCQTYTADAISAEEQYQRDITKKRNITQTRNTVHF